LTAFVAQRLQKVDQTPIFLSLFNSHMIRSYLPVVGNKCRLYCEQHSRERTKIDHLSNHGPTSSVLSAYFETATLTGMGALFSACLPAYNVNGQRYAVKGRLGEGGFSIVELVESSSGELAKEHQWLQEE
jgi:hypothetical protein